MFGFKSCLISEGVFGSYGGKKKPTLWQNRMVWIWMNMICCECCLKKCLSDQKFWLQGFNFQRFKKGKKRVNSSFLLWKLAKLWRHRERWYDITVRLYSLLIHIFFSNEWNHVKVKLQSLQQWLIPKDMPSLGRSDIIGLPLLLADKGIKNWYRKKIGMGGRNIKIWLFKKKFSRI